jgi:putative ABC transport system permease protein
MLIQLLLIGYFLVYIFKTVPLPRYPLYAGADNSTNSLFAVGLVSLPGMMTGQILSGVSPLIAVRYQIMVMCMIFGAAGIASAIFLVLVKSDFDAKNHVS